MLSIAFFITACGGGSGATLPNKTPSKPNILLIMVDDLGYNDLAINNDNKDIDTPNMDQIAREGMRFTRHYATAVCSPARAAVLTGLYPERLGYLPDSRGISPQVTTLPDRLRQEGYTTWHIGKWHIGYLPRSAWPDYQGFDHWFGFLNQWRLAGRHEEGQLALSRPTYHNPWLQGNGAPGQRYPGHLEDILTEKAIAVLSDLDSSGSAWFLNLWFYAPHAPIQPSSAFAAKYPDTKRGKYQALVNQLDYNIGQLVAHLDNIGALDNTIVVVVSDNGGTNAELDNNAPYVGKKSTLTEGGLRTPLIIRWPDASLNGQVFSHTISIEDIYPTLLAAIGVTPPGKLDGNNFYPSIRRLESAPRKDLFWELTHSSHGMLTANGRWRFHQPLPYLGPASYPELYDLELDPTASRQVLPIPAAQMALMEDSYNDWYREVHTVQTVYTPDANGRGVLRGMDFLRTPGFGHYTFGIGISDDAEGQLVSQAGVWNMNRSGDTIIAQLGDMLLSGNIQNNGNCHSIAISGTFHRRISGFAPPGSTRLALYIDGVLAHSLESESVLAVQDTSVETVIADPALSTGTVSPPIIMNTNLSSSTPWTIESFSEELCR